jgi:hypothetical protein
MAAQIPCHGNIEPAQAVGCRFDSDGGNCNRYMRKSGSKLRSQDLRLWIKRKKCVLAKPTSHIMFARLRAEVRSRKPCFSKRGFRQQGACSRDERQIV